MDRRTSGVGLAAKVASARNSTIAVVGASARAAALSVLRSGRRAVAADLFADEDLRRACPVTRISNYPTGLVDWLRDTPCDAWLYTGALENQPELVDELATLKPLLGNSGDVLRRVRDPLRLQESLRQYGLCFPETRASSEGLPQDGTWLAKTYRGSNGVGVSVLDCSAKRGVYYQRNVTGDPCSAVFAGGVLLGVTRQLVGEAWTGAGPFQYCGSLAPWPLSAEPERQLRALGPVLVEEFGLRGLFGVDFVANGHNVWVIEVNPRYTAATEVVEQIIGTHLIDWHVARRRFTERTDAPPLHCRTTCYGKAILFGQLATTVPAGFTRWALVQGDLADIPAAGSSLLPGQPILTIRAEAKSIALILSALKSRMGQIVTRLWGGAEVCDWAL